MVNARKIQEFVIFISQSFLKCPRKAFFPFIYEYNIYRARRVIIQLVAKDIIYTCVYNAHKIIFI